MTTFASGKFALAISDRSGMAFPYNEMVREWNGALVHVSEYEPKQPQLDPKPTSADPQALQRARTANFQQKIFYQMILLQLRLQMQQFLFLFQMVQCK